MSDDIAAAVKALIGAGLPDRVARLETVQEHHGVKISSIEDDAEENRDWLKKLADKVHLYGDVFTHGFRIFPGSELRDAAARYEIELINLKTLAEIRRASRVGAGAVVTIAVAVVLALILKSGPSIIGDVGAIGPLLK